MSAASTDDFARYCCGDPDCPNDCEREEPPAAYVCPRCTSRLNGDRCDGCGWPADRPAASLSERTQAGAGLVWILGWWALAIYCLTLGYFGIAFGASFASLALPIVLPVTHR